jgi:type III pantothenate kinase
MFLIIDIGNTRVKAAIFDETVLLELFHFSNKDFKKNIENLVDEYKVKKALISSVGRLSTSNRRFITNLIPCHELSSESNLTFINKYATPKTLGVDRIALVSAAVNQFPNKNVLVIDAGTCITFDFVNKKNEYLGGAIAPGLKSRYKSLQEYTANLPLLDLKLPKSFIGNSTEESIHSGVVNGVFREIEGVISQYNDAYGKLTVVLTGGDAKFLSSQLKSSIFVAPFFLLEGLYTILKNNIQ